MKQSKVSSKELIQPYLHSNHHFYKADKRVLERPIPLLAIAPRIIQTLIITNNLFAVLKEEYYHDPCNSYSRNKKERKTAGSQLVSLRFITKKYSTFYQAAWKPYKSANPKMDKSLYLDYLSYKSWTWRK